ncbi:acyltransferase family protein [Paracidobacterium acidisoli]|nr:acyltransferase [Paracidobacterium acidisoli]MBT9333164.1 acyltransferase [Paracidobacterium acidisoli]
MIAVVDTLAVPASHSPATSLRRKPLNALTGARFLAAFYVVLYHFASRPASEHRLPEALICFLQNGYMGVPFFFLLSGFVLAYSYSGDTGRSKSPFSFWAARIARVYPVYLLSLALNWPFRNDGPWHIVLSKGAMAATAAAVQTWNPHYFYLAQAWNPPAWTLSVEAFFYLCFPFVLPFCTRMRTRQRLSAMAALVLVIVFCHTALPVDHLQGIFRSILVALPIPVVRLPEFLLGILIGQHYLEKQPSSVSGRALLSLAATIVILCTLHGHWLTLSVLPLAVLIYELAAGGGLIGRWLSNRVLVFLGGASYAVYLLQFPVRNWVRVAFERWNPRGASLGAVVSPLLLILIACAVFEWYEEPSRRLIRGWLTPRKSQA